MRELARPGERRTLACGGHGDVGALNGGLPRHSGERKALFEYWPQTFQSEEDFPCPEVEEYDQAWKDELRGYAGCALYAVAHLLSVRFAAREKGHSIEKKSLSDTIYINVTY